MEALGYKANKQPMRLLAQRLPLAALPREPLVREAALLGAAGFLPQTSDRHWDAASRRRAKDLWARWWKLREEFENTALDPRLWRFRGLRPQNFPQRRLAAMSLLLTKHPQLADDLRALITRDNEPKNTIVALENLFCGLDDPFWSRHYNFGASAREPVALVGRPRARDIIVNVVLPFLVAHAQATCSATLEHNAVALWEIFPRLSPHSVETFAVYRFFGPKAATTKILSRARRQQGLLQLVRDFCLNDSSACARCPLPDLLSRWPKSS
jgi:hypothetical protein